MKAAVGLVVALFISFESAPGQSLARPGTDVSVSLQSTSMVIRTDALQNSQPIGESHSRKEPAIALGLSILVPGSGQIYNGEIAKGLTIAGLFYGGIGMVALADITKSHNSITGYGWMCVATIAAADIWGMIDAATTASRLSEEPAPTGHAIEMQIGDRPVALDAGILPSVAAVRIQIGL